jgi:predicted nucleic acid-binding protein
VNGFLVDTNVVSEFSRRGEPDQRVTKWLGAASAGSLYVSVLALAEVRRGIELLARGRRRDQLEHWLENDLLGAFNEANVLPVTRAVGDRWAIRLARAQAQGIQSCVIDGLIAASAIEHNLTLVTRNVKDFAGFGVEIFNPWDVD